jgi:3-dehydroquinate dehydratase-1
VGMARTIRVRSGIIGSGREPLICTPLVGRTAVALRGELGVATGKAPDIIEWRADFFGGIADTDDVLATARALADAARGIPLLFTVRSAREGGQPVPLTDAQRTALVLAVAESGTAELIDFEMSASMEHVGQVRAAARASGTQLILSFHDFRATPDVAAIYGKFERAHALGGDVAKVAVMPNDPGDVLALLEATFKAHTSLELPLIGISMGALGIASRVLGWMFGSAVTFAEGEGSSAPGQLPIDELKAALRILQRARAAG